MNFDFQCNNKENIGVNANLISNITDCNQIPVLPNYVSNIRQKNPNIFDNIPEVFKDFNFKEDFSEEKTQKSYPEVFKDYEFKKDLYEETKKATIKTPFVRLFLFLIS